MDIQTLKKSLCKGEECLTGTYTLKENGDKATLTNVTMCDIPLNALIVKMDGIKFEKFFNNKIIKDWGFNKHSDYLIITRDRLVFIEMKSTKDVSEKLEEECFKKFASDSCTINYADEIFMNLLSKNPIFRERELHYVLLFQSTSINKNEFSKTTQSPNKTPKTFRKIGISNKDTISYNRMI